MADKRLVLAGMAGLAAAALCCFTPILVWLLAAIGLSAALGGLDYALAAVAAACLVLIVVGLRRKPPT